MAGAPPSRPLALARRRGITRGLLGDSTFWLLAGLLAWGLEGLRRAVRPTRPAAGTTLRLKPGERLVVSHGAAPRRR
ncbi:MAG: hypothetical protein J4F44_01260 [Acidimicrobiia bacterium]|nr:hypothetical protein [Acidimicrobiia bacterium]